MQSPWLTLSSQAASFHPKRGARATTKYEIFKTRILKFNKIVNYNQGGRTWQPFVGGKNGHANFRQARTYNFRDKCVVFGRNRKFANLTQ